MSLKKVRENPKDTDAPSIYSKALTIKQPWTDYIRARKKPHPSIRGAQTETRSWPTNYRGPLVLCSAQRIDLEEVCYYPEERCGIVVAHAVLVDCTFNEEFEDYDFALTEVRSLPPVPVKGALNIFDLPKDVVRALEAVDVPMRHLRALLSGRAA